MWSAARLRIREVVTDRRKRRGYRQSRRTPVGLNTVGADLWTNALHCQNLVTVRAKYERRLRQIIHGGQLYRRKR